MTRRERILFTVLALVCLGSLTVALVGEHGYREVRRLHNERDRLETEIGELEVRRNRLSREIEGISQDPRAVERRARQDLGMVKPGETVFLLPGSTSHEP